MRLRKLKFFGLCLGLLLAAWPGLAQTPRPPTEYQVKAAILFNFAKFIDWPPESLGDDKAPFIIGILGDNPFGDDLEQTVAGKKINEHSIAVQTFRKAADATHCQILFISKSEKKQFSEIIQNLRGTAVLTVSQTDGFIESGGMVNFVPDPTSRKIRFQINADATKAARLKVSSKLLSVAVAATR
jgi:hypothetical protein